MRPTCTVLGQGVSDAGLPRNRPIGAASAHRGRCGQRPPPEEVLRMPYHCPGCGATYNTDETCEDRFNASQAQELADPAYYAVHHFSVPCIMLQHNRYSQDGWIRVRQLLARFLRGLTPQEARHQYRTAVDSRNRTYSFTRGPTLAGVDAIAWTRTIADVR